MRKILSWLLCIAVVFTMTPAVAFAKVNLDSEEGERTFSSIKTSDNVVNSEESTTPRRVQNEIIASIGDTKYDSLSKAIAAVTSSEQTTITMLADTKEDVTISSTQNIILDLNGCVIQKNGTSTNAVITNNGILTVKDSNQTTEHKFTGEAEDATEETKKYEDAGLWSWDETGGTNIVSGGVITGNNTSCNKGGAIYNANSAKLYFNAGTLVGNTARGAGVFNNGELFMTGGLITHNEGATDHGAAIHNQGTATVSGGTISYNHMTSAFDSGISNYTSGKLTISGTAKICYNSASGSSSKGGGVGNGSGCTLTIDGGEIFGNYAQTYGGGVMIYGGTATMNSGSIHHNYAYNQGGGVHVMGTFNLKGGSISNNTSGRADDSSGRGSGVIVNGESGASLDMTGGSITDNTALWKYRAGLEVCNGTATISGGTISGNTSPGSGGTPASGFEFAIYSFTKDKVEIKGNPTINGKVHAYYDFTVDGGTFNGPFAIDEDESAQNKVKIKSGKFADAITATSSIASPTITGFITGGIFTDNAKNGTDVSYLAAGTVFTQNQDAATKTDYPWMVDTPKVAQIGDTKYETLAAAVAAAKAGQTPEEKTITIIGEVGAYAFDGDCSGIMFQGSDTGKVTGGWTVQGSGTDMSDITIRDLDFAEGGNIVFSTATKDFRNLKIQDCTFTGTGAASTPAISIGTGKAPYDGIEISGNKISGYSGTGSSAIIVNNDNGNANSGTVTIARNDVSDFGHNGVQFVLAQAELVIKNNAFTAGRTDKDVLNLNSARSAVVTRNTFTVPAEYSTGNQVIWNSNAGTVIDASGNTFVKGDDGQTKIEDVALLIGGSAGKYVAYQLRATEAGKYYGGFLVSQGDAALTDNLAEGCSAVCVGKTGGGLNLFIIGKNVSSDSEKLTGGLYSSNPVKYIKDEYYVKASGDSDYPFEVAVKPEVDPGQQQIITDEKTDVSIDNEAIETKEDLQKAEEALENTEVTGVAEAVTEDGARNIIKDAVEDEASTEITQQKINDATLVDIAITVKAEITAAVVASAETEGERLLTFELTPVAVVTATDANGKQVSSAEIKVDNDYLSKEKIDAITVKAGCDFEPVQVLHFREDGVVESFTKGTAVTDPSYTDRTFTYDEQSKTVTLKINQFSELKMLGANLYAEVTFDGNSGTGSMEPVYVKKGSEYELPANGFEAPAGKEFKGWLFGNKVYSQGEKITITEDTELIAQWQTKSDPTPTPSVTRFTVTFDAQGHGMAPVAQRVVKGRKAIEPEAPVEEGYVFCGWFKDKECTDVWDFDRDTVTKNITLYAKWASNIENCKLTLSSHKFAFADKVTRPKITVESADGVLVEGTDYTVEIPESIRVGTYNVVITGIGSYAGTISDSYIINPPGKSIKTIKARKKKLSVKWKKSSRTYNAERTAYQIRYSTSKSFRTYKTKTVNKKDSHKTIKGLKAHKKYYVKMRAYKIVDGKRYYSPWSKVKVKRTR